ncbi:hypothetical protein HN415_07910 [Candidatus Woesearchaeota archaeon]|nr:hypothetical protein [Candidatus Woesearchaeota archaeon]
MDVKNLLGKLHNEDGEATEKPVVPVPPTPKKPQVPHIEDRVMNNIPNQAQPNPIGGRHTMMSNDDLGIILDLGEGISLNIPIQKRMSLSDFIKLAEKVKALEMLSESNERFNHQL